MIDDGLLLSRTHLYTCMCCCSSSSISSSLLHNITSLCTITFTLSVQVASFVACMCCFFFFFFFVCICCCPVPQLLCCKWDEVMEVVVYRCESAIQASCCCIFFCNVWWSGCQGYGCFYCCGGRATRAILLQHNGLSISIRSIPRKTHHPERGNTAIFFLFHCCCFLNHVKLVSFVKKQLWPLWWQSSLFQANSQPRFMLQLQFFTRLLCSGSRIP